MTYSELLKQIELYWAPMNIFRCTPIGVDRDIPFGLILEFSQDILDFISKRIKELE